MVRRPIFSILTHPDYDRNATDYDFSLLLMKETINFLKYPHIRPICLPVDTSNNYNDYEATVSGWGTLSNDVEKGSSKLMEVNVKVMTNSECRNNFRYHYSWITEQMLCANGFRKDACKGDSGINNVVKVIRFF